MMMYLPVNSFLLHCLVNTFSVKLSSTTHHLKYIKMLIAIQYYHPNYRSILQEDCPVLFSPLLSCIHFLYVFGTFSFAVTQNNVSHWPNVSVLIQMGFNDDTKIKKTIAIRNHLVMNAI